MRCPCHDSFDGDPCADCRATPDAEPDLDVLGGGDVDPDFGPGADEYAFDLDGPCDPDRSWALRDGGE